MVALFAGGDMAYSAASAINHSGAEKVDYEKFLLDVNLGKEQGTEGGSSLEGTVDGLGTTSSKNHHKNVLLDLKKALKESVDGLGKSFDDLYSMFCRWDSNGNGTITAAQFLRALDRLHVNLSDEDQDTLIEILDIDGMGRVNFEGLLDSCFSQTVDATSGASIFGASANSPILIPFSMLLLSMKCFLSKRTTLLFDTGEESEGASISGGSFAGSLVEGMFPEVKPMSRKQRPATASSWRPQVPAVSVYDGTDNESLSLVASPTSNRSRRPLTADGKIGSKYMKSKKGERQVLTKILL